MADDLPELVRLEDYRPPAFLIDTVDLQFDLDPAETIVRNRMRVRRAENTAPDVPLKLDGEGLTLRGLRLNGEPLSANQWRADETGLTVLTSEGAFDLEIETAIRPADNKTRSGLLEVGGKLMTQCEAHGFRKLTYFLDRPDVLSTYTVTLRADAARYPVLLSNGNPDGAGQGPDGRHWTRWRDPFPKPCYIFGVFAGDFGRLEDQYETASGRKVALSIYADRDKIERCRFAMHVVKRSMAWDERTYGLEYDLDTFSIVAVTGWSGAMENKGVNLFGASGILADPEIATDEDFVIIERIVGHEQFHNWTGNRVTCRDWFQLCLKEGLTRFRDQQFIEDKLGADVWRIESVKQLRRNQFPEDDGPAAHPVQPSAFAEIDNFYTNTVYDKGAEVVRMLRALLGPVGFRRGFDLYIARHDGDAVTTEAFVRCMEDASGRDLTQFRRWYIQAGRPRVRASWTYDRQSRDFSLTVSQTCPSPSGRQENAPFHIPLAVGLVSRTGEALAWRGDGKSMTSTVLSLTQPSQTFLFRDVPNEPIPSLLRGFSAPVTLESDASDDDLAVLMAFDKDPFARWDASQTLAIRIVRRLAAECRQGREMTAPSAYLEAVGKVLADEAAGDLLRSLILMLPDEPVLSEGLASIDLDGHFAARDFLRREIATSHGPQLRGLYERLSEPVPYVSDLAGIGRRKLRAATLDLLTSLGTDEAAQLCLDQLTSARNMTDMFEALCLLCHLDGPQRQAGVDWFYERWCDQPTVVDKWFNAQALSRCAGAVEKIVALEQHPAYEFANYSQSLAYYGGFFRQNRLAFHDPSGRGYAFLADRLLTIDRLGRSGSHYLMPQINQWRRYDPHRQALMRAALERVAETPGLSKGLRENISRALS